MLLPLMMFVVACVGFTVLGLLVLVSVPTLRLTVRNLIIFVIGAFLGAAAVGFVYGRLFADSRNELNSTGAILGFFLVTLVGALLGGAVLVRIGMRLHGSSVRREGT